MKNQTKNYCVLLFSLLALLFNNACSGTFSVDLASADSEQQLKEKINKVIDNDDMVVEISFGTTSSAFTSDMEMATVNYYPAGKKDQMCKIVPLGKGDIRDSKPSSYAFDVDDDTDKARAIGVKFSDIDFSKIHTNIAKAIELMAADSLEYSGIGDYRMKLSYPDKIKHTFTLQSSAGTQAKTGNRGLSLETKFYEIKFEADAEGNVELKK